MFLLNNHQSNTYTEVKITLSELGVHGGAATVRDVWVRADAGVATESLVLRVSPRDSRFMLLSPTR